LATRDGLPIETTADGLQRPDDAAAPGIPRPPVDGRTYWRNRALAAEHRARLLSDRLMAIEPLYDTLHARFGRFLSAEWVAQIAHDAKGLRERGGG